MTDKKLVLEGYGSIMINPIAIKQRDYETVDSAGNPVTSKVIGAKARTGYFNAEGIEVPRNQICRKMMVEDEEIILPKFQPTKEVAGDYIEEIDDNGLIYRGLERRFYSTSSDDEKLKDLVINQNKSLKFPLAVGVGWKIWQGILTNWNGKLLLVACIGDIKKELDKYSEDTVELEIEVLPQHKDMKKLVMAMAQV